MLSHGVDSRPPQGFKHQGVVEQNAGEVRRILVVDLLVPAVHLLHGPDRLVVQRLPGVLPGKAALQLDGLIIADGLKMELLLFVHIGHRLLAQKGPHIEKERQGDAQRQQGGHIGLLKYFLDLKAVERKKLSHLSHPSNWSR